MKFLFVGSGSNGNATLVINKGRILLIDMGVSLKRLKAALNEEGYNLIDIEAMVLTHDHSDHTSGIRYLDQLPVYTLCGTYDSPFVEEVLPFVTYEIAGLKVTPVKTSHDAFNPCGFVIENDAEKFVYITDTGKIPTKTQSKIKNADYYVFESNHDVEMLLNTNRPKYLKDRILSDKGHLSNEQSARYLAKLIGPKTKAIYLAHLSEEANTPELALETHKRIYKDLNISLENIELKCLSRHELRKGGN